MRSLTDPLLEPLVFSIRKSTEALEAHLAAPGLSAALPGILFEAETISGAVSRLAAALDRRPRSEAPRAPPAATDLLRNVELALAALDGSPFCPRCGGVVVAGT